MFFVGIENVWLYNEVNSVALQRNQIFGNRLKIVTTETIVRFFYLHIAQFRLYLTGFVVFFVFFVGIENFWSYTVVNSVALQQNQNFENRLEIVTTEATVRFFLTHAV